jgi:hypothetical protein
VAIDDQSRIAFAAILPGQSHRSAILFFLMVRAYFNLFCITIHGVYSDKVLAIATGSIAKPCGYFI